MTTRYLVLCCASFALCLSLSTAPLHAAASFVVSKFPAGARVTLNGRPVATLRTPNLGLQPMERAALAVKKLEAFLAAGGRPIKIQPRLIEEGAGVYADDTLVMVATAAEAKAQRRTPFALAYRWARDLRAALTLPPLEPVVARRPTTDHRRPTADQRPKIPAKRVEGSPVVGRRSSVVVPPKAQHPTPNTQHPTPTAPTPPPPKLTLSARELVVPAGEGRAVRVTAAGTVTVDTQETGIIAADVTSDGTGAAVLVEGVAPGKATVRVTCGESTVMLPVTVMEYAGVMALTPKASVTGRPCPVELVRDTALAAIQDAVSPRPGATATLGRLEGPTRALEPGQSATVRVPVAVAGMGYLPVDGTVTVTVTNRALRGQEPRVLLYSNNPESFTDAGSLFLGELENDVCTRLLYHHQNMMGRPIHLRVDLVNAGAEPAEVQVIEGAAGPTWDTVMVGHRAAARYLRNWRQDVGAIAMLAPGTRRTIVSQRMAEKLAVSGIYGLRLLSPRGTESRVRVEVVADDVPIAPREVSAEMASRPLSDHVYTTVRKELQARFVVGGNWAFINVGKKPIRNKDARKQLDGNYGVLYDIALEVDNPTDQERVVTLTLSPDAGLAMGVFLIDGTLVEAPQITPPTEAPLATFRLKPGERRTVPIQTIPVGGSNYPISLVVRATPPPTQAARATNRS